MPTKYKTALIALLLILCWGIGWHGGHDLEVYYAAATWAAKGRAGDIYANNASLGHFFYGPAAFALLAPLGHLPFSVVHWIWLALETLAFFAFWHFLRKLYPQLWSRSVSWLWVLVWIVSIKPIHATFQSFNVQLFIAAAFLAAEAWADRDDGYSFLGGALIAFAAAIKVYPAFIVVFYWLCRSPRARAGTFFGFIVALLLPIAAFGWHTGAILPGQFLRNLPSYHDAYNLAADTVSLSLPSLVARWSVGIISAASANWIALLLGLVVSVIFFFWTWQNRMDFDERSRRYRWALALALMALLNSASRPDSYIFYVPAFCCLAELIQRKALSMAQGIAMGISFVLLAFLTEWTLGSRELNHRLEALRVPVLGMILLCLVLMQAVRYYNKSENRTYSS